MSEPDVQVGANLPQALHVVESDHFGAVPVFWGDDVDGPLTATLTFRVGEADERLRTRGRCHLVRALVLDDLEIPGAQISGSITTLRTSFTATGDDGAVAEAISAIARRITALRTDRARVLIPEILARWTKPAEWDTGLMSLRFGSRGYGLPALPLLGLTDLDPGAFDEWTRNWFNADNSVVSASRRPPSALTLGALGDGVRKPLPDPHQIERPLPAIGAGPEGQVSVSFLSRFDSIAEVLFDLVVSRIHARCQGIDPHIPRPETVARRTGTGLATIGISIRAASAMLPRVRDAISSELFALSMTGPTPDELGRIRIGLRRARNHSTESGVTTVEKVAYDHLFGEDRNTGAALRAEAADLAKIARDALPRSIWLVPSSVPILDQRLIPIGSAVPDPIDGDVYLPTTPSGGTDSTRLTISRDAIEISGPEGTASAHFSDLVAVEIHPDNTRTLWSVDGTRIDVDPTTWDSGTDLGTVIDNRVDPWVLLDTRHQSLPTPTDL